MPYKIPTDQEIRTLARELYGHEGEIEIDDTATVSLSEDHGTDGPQGAYVQAWVYVPFDEVTNG
jgi:hypothetical protein